MKTTLKFIIVTVLLAVNGLYSADTTVEAHKSFLKSFKEKYILKAKEELRDGYIIDTYKEYTHQEWQQGAWVNEYYEVAEIDTAGDAWTWTSTEYLWDNGQWLQDHKYVVKTTPMLGDDPKFIESYSYVWSSNSWVALSRISYQYEGISLKAALIEIAIDVNVFFPFQKYEYGYNQLNQLTDETIFNYESDWKPASKKTLTYDNAGNMVDLLEANWRENNWLDTLRTAMSYNQLSLVDETIESFFENRQEIPIRKMNYSYNSVGQTILMSTYLYLESTWEEMQKDNYEYNTDDLLTTLLIEVRFANGFVPSAKYSFTYNSQLQEIEALEQKHDGANWKNYARVLTNYTPTSVEENLSAVKGFELYNNYPNPFNPTTKIKYAIPAVVTGHPDKSGQVAPSLHVSLKVFDILGNEVATLVNEEKSAGEYSVQFDASTLPSGVYIYQLKAGEFSAAQRMILMK